MSKREKLFWLISLLALLFVMVLVGGTTRLTKSGLSITEWRPVTGLLPPLTEEDWKKEFTLYQKTPEFRHHNSHFEIEDYKGIFWWEYIHRVLGRVIFLFASVLSFVFWRRREWSGRRALVLPLLIAFQGVIGWLMVKTGLHQRPSVSHLMLTLHFLLALTTMSLVYHPLARLKKPIFVNLSRGGHLILWAMGFLILLQIVYGCFTAGLKAGLYFNTFPLMGGEVTPAQVFEGDHGWLNFLENPVAVQWVHRWLGVALGLFLPFGALLLTRFESRDFRRPLLHLVSVIGVQIVLGIINLIWLVPISLAVAHQGMALLIWLGYCNLVFRIQASELSLGRS